MSYKSFPGLNRVVRKKDKPAQPPPPPSPPPSSPPRPRPRARAKQNHTEDSAGDADSPRGPRQVQEHAKRPAPASSSVHEGSSGEEEAPAPIKPKKRARPSTSEDEPEPRDEDEHVQLAPKAKPKARALPVVDYNAEVIRQFERVIRAKTQDTRREEGVEPIYQDARSLVRVAGTYVDFHVVLPRGLANDGRAPEDNPGLLKLKWNIHWQVEIYYRAIKSVFPTLMDNAAYLRQRPDLVGGLAKWMKAVAGKARSDDLGRIKDKILGYAGIKDTTGCGEKTNRGFKHMETARLLCPVTMLEQFDADPEGFSRPVRDMHEKRPHLRGRKWPLLMYNMKQYTPGDQQAGFLKSDLLLKVALNIFTGPSSAKTNNARIKVKGKPPIIRKMTFEGFSIVTIVYIASLARFALNAQHEWMETDGDFSGLQFAESVFTCALEDDEWHADICEWYSKRVMDNSSPEDPEAESDDESGYELMLAQIRAKKAQKAAVEQQPGPVAEDAPEAGPSGCT